ncbi:DoxX family protein [Gordonia amicalis]|uniref:DoxX family protein n=1 Tax=Gordonia amicalis TaxID=89053 RepID=UPI0002A6585A|nr:DoxX family protein [Gordonia amicalis]MBA5848130.1 DoxX family protein [Gordonia amicalis]MCZ0915170.1 DoxX family protein [Gordonia amicalis]MDV7172554.1 DoxX family protein [Gordonia amicalis]NKX76142.1 DoxX family protein [Gordonia amicalis]UKO92813.1 DoxX family protein [Gordonia amicalis]
MTTDTTTITRSSDTSRGRNRRRITGIVISVLVGAFLAFDVVGKLTRPQSVVDGTEKLGFDSDQAIVMGIVLLICLVVYAIPRTAVLGALGITAYLGGAVTANMRIEEPLFSTVLFAVYLGVLMWIGLVLRRPELLKVAGLRR